MYDCALVYAGSGLGQREPDSSSPVRIGARDCRARTAGKLFSCDPWCFSSVIQGDEHRASVSCMLNEGLLVGQALIESDFTEEGGLERAIHLVTAGGGIARSRDLARSEAEQVCRSRGTPTTTTTHQHWCLAHLSTRCTSDSASVSHRASV